MDKDRKHGNEDKRIAELAEFSELIAGPNGRLLHLLHLELLRPGAGVWFQRGPADGDEEDAIPSWPDEGETDPLEDSFGDDADRIRLITEEELGQLRQGGNPTGTAPDPDFTKTGSIGKPQPFTPTDDWPWKYASHLDGKWRRIGRRPLPACGTLWIFDFYHFKRVAPGAAVNYARLYRPTLLRAFAEAFRLCRERDEDCPNARLWLLFASWSRSVDDKLVTIHFKLAVACVAA